ncbi:hypothetical protein GGQ80_003694 [Sphingomonas jinjuensis]|uniref:DUF3489 domain-containing protein n=1 Tax=Sphingomonas jinjuensis TaxID=535907 RepID=A0A840F964_9SPHN|nr:DUF3489 domain-containing protein [Sphingomonas jinjuensis]MBB4155763.1 hypothetical protein [Sphingomonas jinjuensis]
MTKLNDTHRILLAAAGQRNDASLLPLPASLTANAWSTKALATLVTFGFAEERETNDAAAVHRIYADLRLGLFATPSGLAAIGIELNGDESQPVTNAGKDGDAPPAVARTTKQAHVLALLGRYDGATLADLIAATGWLPHTTRAALTGLRKKGHQIERSKRDDATCYRLLAAA